MELQFKGAYLLKGTNSMGYVVSFEGRLKMGKTDKDLKKRK
jgi:hypothetical protein